MREWDAGTVLIEDKASGIQLAQELSAQSWKFKGVKCECDKVMRLMAQTASIENGRVLFPKEAPWLREYANELLAFPMAKYDDQVDSTAQALKYVASSAEPVRNLDESNEARKPNTIGNHVEKMRDRLQRAAETQPFRDIAILNSVAPGEAPCCMS
jgi:hypothetical protein